MKSTNLKTYTPPTVNTFGKMSDLIEAGSLSVDVIGGPAPEIFTVDASGNVSVLIDGTIPSPFGTLSPVPSATLSVTSDDDGSSATVFRYNNPLTFALITDFGVIQLADGTCLPVTVDINTGIVTIEGQGASEPTFTINP